jgi:hypothetical protein
MCVGLFCVLSACAPHVYVKSFDMDQDGHPDKEYRVLNGRIFREDLDRNHNGTIDTYIHYGESGTITSIEYDSDEDGRIDGREEYYADARARSFRDEDGDGVMDRSWLTYYGEEGRPVYMELDLDNDDRIDSKINLDEGVRENLLHGRWYKDVTSDDHHGVWIQERWFPVEFCDGDWRIVPMKLGSSS